MRVLLTVVIGILFGALGIVWILLPYHKGLNYTSTVHQEIRVEDPSAGFEYSVGYDGGQDFYWEEIVSSRDYKIDVLVELGRPIHNHGHLLSTPIFQKFIPRMEGKRESLFLGLRYRFLEAPFVEVPDYANEELDAHILVFQRHIRAKGIDSEIVGDPFLTTEDINTPADIFRRIGHKILIASIASALGVFLLFRRQDTKPEQVAAGNPPG